MVMWLPHKSNFTAGIEENLEAIIKNNSQDTNLTSISLLAIVLSDNV